MSSSQKILRMTIFLFVVIVFSTFTSWTLGYQGFLLIGNIELHEHFIYLLEFVLYSINIIVLFSISLNKYGIEGIKISIPYLIVNFIIELFYTSFITTTIFPVIYILGFSIYFRDFKGTVIRSFITLSVISIYQVLMLFVKTNSFYFGYNVLPIYQGFVFSIDLIIFLSIIYFIGGHDYYVRLVVRRSNVRKSKIGKYSLFPENIEIAQVDEEDLIEIEEYNNLKGWEKLKAISIVMGFQVLQWLIILFVCNLGNVLLEGIIVTTSFVFYGLIIKRRWHSNSLIVCTLSSAGLFYACARLIPPIWISQFIPVLISLLLIYGMYRYAIIEESHKENIENKKRKIKEENGNLLDEEVMAQHYNDIEGLGDYCLKHISRDGSDDF